MILHEKTHKFLQTHAFILLNIGFLFTKPKKNVIINPSEKKGEVCYETKKYCDNRPC